MKNNSMKKTAIEKLNIYIDFFKNYEGESLPKRLVIIDLQSVKRTLEKEMEEE